MHVFVNDKDFNTLKLTGLNIKWVEITFRESDKPHWGIKDLITNKVYWCYSEDVNIPGSFIPASLYDWHTKNQFVKHKKMCESTHKLIGIKSKTKIKIVEKDNLGHELKYKLIASMLYAYKVYPKEFSSECPEFNKKLKLIDTIYNKKKGCIDIIDKLGNKIKFVDD